MDNENKLDAAETADDTEFDPVEWNDELDQNEINDLLGFDLSSEEGEDRSGLRVLINSSFVAHRRMPLLDIMYDRTARQMTTSLRHLTNDNVDVALDDTSALRFGEFIQSLPTPAVIGVLKAPELNGYCLLAVDAMLVFSIVDLLLGGRRGGPVLSFEDRSFTQIELGLIENVVTLFADDLSKAITPIAEVNFALDRLETTPRFASIAQDASVCSLAKFRIEMEDRGGRAAILFPHATLEPVRKTLQREFVAEAGEASWSNAFRENLEAASVDLKAVIAEKELSIGALSDLKVGDHISFPASSGTVAQIRAGSMPVAEADIGKAGETIALRLRDDQNADQGEAA